MAAITATNIQGTGWKATTVTTLGASDTLTYDASKNQVLILVNNTGGALTPNIDGDGASTAIPVRGWGTVDASGGSTSASVADGAAATMLLSANSAVMVGTVTITGGDGMEAILAQF